MNFLEQLQAHAGPQVAQQLTSRYGMDPETAEDILPRMAPFVLGGLHSQMQHPGDVDAASTVLDNHADESAYDDVDSHFERAAQNEPDSEAVMGGLFGNQSQAASSAMANQLGVSSDMLAKILPILAPIILGAVMKRVKSGNVPEPQAGVESTGSGGMDILGSILGQTGASGGLGSILGSVLGGRGGRSSNGGGGGGVDAGGVLGSILGGGSASNSNAGGQYDEPQGGGGNSGGLANKAGCLSAILGMLGGRK